MSMDSVRTGSPNNLLVGAEKYAANNNNNNDGAAVNGAGFEAGGTAAPAPVKRGLLQIIKDFFSNSRMAMMSAHRSFSAMADRTLEKVLPNMQKAAQDTGPAENPNNAQRSEDVPVDDSIASHTTPFANGTTQAKLNANIALIDKMTDGDTKLPSNIKTMMGLSPTLMTHIKNYADAESTFRIADEQTAQDVLYDQEDFGEISLSPSRMAANPQNFLSSLAESLVSQEAYALHGLPSELQLNKDDILNFERAVNDPFGEVASSKNKVDINALDKANKEVDIPKITHELAVVFSTYSSLIEPQVSA